MGRGGDAPRRALNQGKGHTGGKPAELETGNPKSLPLFNAAPMENPPPLQDAVRKSERLRSNRDFKAKITGSFFNQKY